MRCLLVHDLQNDFFQNGTMNVAKPADYIVLVNKIFRLSGKKFDLVVATQDYHVPHHHAFASNNPGKHLDEKIELHNQRQILWPDHCIQNSPGASFHPALDIQYINFVVKKGMNPMFDTASAFFDKGREKTQLHEYLQFKKIKHITAFGMALDLGLTQTALDGKELGYEMTLIKDLTPAYKIPPEKIKLRWEELLSKNVELISAADLFI